VNGLFQKIGTVNQPRRGKRALSMILIMALIFTTVILPVPIAFASTASVTTDKESYKPGEIVEINGTGFDANMSISIKITKPDTTTGEPTGEEIYDTVSSNSSGGFTYHYELIEEEAIFGIYQVDASDGINSASCTFIDPPVPIIDSLPPITEANTMMVSWTMPGESAGSVDGYEIQQATDLEFSTAISATTQEMNYTFTGLAYETTYYYRVCSFKTIGNKKVYSEWSVVESTTTKDTTPINPPVADAGGPYSGNEGSPISVDASGSYDPDGGTIVTYEWDWDYDGTTFDPSGDEGVTQSHTWPNDGSFTVAVRVTNDVGSTAIDTAAVTVNNVAPIANAGPDQTVDMGSQIVFEGSAIDPGTDTLTYSWDFGDGNTATGQTVAHAYADAGSYTVTLTVSDGKDTGTHTCKVTVRDTMPPSAPVSLNAVDTPNDQGGSIDLSWTASTDNVGVDGYKVYRATAPGGPYGDPIADGIKITSYTDKTATLGTTFYYIVRSYDAAGNISDPSNEVNAFSIDNIAPSKPTGLKASSDGSKITLTWDANAESDLAGYNLYRATDVNGPYEKISGSLLTVTTLNDSNVSLYKDYYYMVKAVDTSGNESDSSKIVRADITPPPAPSGVSASAGNESVTVGWKTVSITDLGGYNVYKKEGDGTLTKVNSSLIGGDVTYYTVTGLTNGINYEFVIEAIDTLGNVGEHSNAVSAIPNDTGLISTSQEVDSTNNEIVVTKDSQPRLNLIADSTVYSDTVFAINEITSANVPSGIVSVVHDGNAYDITPSSGTGISTTSETNNILRIYYDQALIDASGKSEADIKVLHWNGSSWDVIEPSASDPDANWVEASVSGFSPYAVGYEAGSITTMLESTEAYVCYTGNWGTWEGENHSGGSMKASKTVGDYAEFTFKGHTVTWIGNKNFNRGIAEVYIDGVYQADVDLYSPDILFQANLFTKSGIADEVHTLKIRVKDKNPESSDYYIVTDAFEVTTGTSSTTTRFEECGSTTNYVYYNGAWGTWFGDNHSGGAIMASKSVGNSVDFSFIGTGVTWYGNKNFNRGIAEVYVDGVYQTTVDLYSVDALFQQNLFSIDGLADGNHNLKIVVKGKNANSSDYYVVIDAFDVKAADDTITRFEEMTYANINYTGNWGTWSGENHSDGMIKASKTTGDYVEFKFTGTNITWIGNKNFNRGIAEVYINGVYKKDVDLYSSDVIFQAQLFTISQLADAEHTITIKVKGKNSSSSDYYIPIDAFEVIK